VEACDGTSVMHDALPVTIAQIGVCLVSYQGDQGSWVHRLYRRDLWLGGMDPVEEALELLERPAALAGWKLSHRATRSAISAAARSRPTPSALSSSSAHGGHGSASHGHPLAYELLTGSGMVGIWSAVWTCFTRSSLPASALSSCRAQARAISDNR
jgi:hypothetical protein